MSRSETGVFPILGPRTLHHVLTMLAAVADVAVIVAMAVAVGLAYHLAVHGMAGAAGDYLRLGIVTACLFCFAGIVRGDYAPVRSALSNRDRGVLQPWTLTFVLLLVLGFATKSAAVHSRGYIVLFYALTLPVLVAQRAAVAALAARWGETGLFCLRRVFLFGDANSIRALVADGDLRRHGLSIVGCHFETPVHSGASEADRRANLGADLDTAVARARPLAPDAVVIMRPWSEKDALAMCVDRLKALPVDIHLGHDVLTQALPHAPPVRLGAFTGLQLARAPLSPMEQRLKRAVDLVCATLALILLTPLLALVAAMVMLDSRGPVFFLQRRCGFNQRPFRIVKFRTMHTVDDGAVVIQAAKGDPRITRVGRILRRWNIDEIPQLFNVIMGDMSLVGPRPHAMAHDEEYTRKIDAYARRHNVKPGITGWAQVHGLRGETDTQDKMERRVEHDVYYIDNWSLLLDLTIMIRTVVSPSAYRNAY